MYNKKESQFDEDLFYQKIQVKRHTTKSLLN